MPAQTMTLSSNGVPAPKDAAAFVAHALASRPEHLAYTRALVDRASTLAPQFDLADDDRDLLLAGAHLCTLGPVLFATDHAVYDWSTLNLALWLAQHGMDPVAGLLMWSGSTPEMAALRGHAAALDDYPCPSRAVADALTVALVTVSPTGDERTLQQTLVAVRARHGADSTAARALEAAWPRLEALMSSSVAPAHA